MEPKFRTGDLVRRPFNVHNHKEGYMHGVICARYKDMDSRFGPYPELYAVIWDHNSAINYAAISMGYLGHGLDLVARNTKKW
jgi:hypothetical protein